ncbi:MAG: ATP-dependent DNA helicase RecQ [Akkermansiaceae bacterium]|nr:ATP-dependent DNA helicase RecQ [Akkermansiaceae bacterium]MCP5550887.1 ATP-dependent DNA helicase RecQ [Akkermansiaceae bacterium]
MPDTTSSGPAAETRDAREALERHFGFGEFLAGQERVVSALLAGRDALVVMPTGGGKSLCYQLPALVMDGVTLVISPLIALMKDQVDGLVRRGVPATMINSTLSPSEQQARIQEMRRGKHKLVYVAPERFRSQAFTNALSQVEIALFAVDEAHCLSQWGHDFRPDYLRLAQALEALDHPQTAAFTATATEDVRADILKHLALRDPFVSISGFERPNLSLAVTQISKVREKYDRLEAIVREHKTGIVYCATRRKVEEVADSLALMGVKVVAYHGGMEDAERERVQNVFLDRGKDVAVATNAFGMGIDRSDVRFVVHFETPGSIEAYYQEAGRAGRDGEPAVCELLFNYADTRTQEFFIDGNNPGYDVICDLYTALRTLARDRGEVMMSIRDLADTIGVKNDMAVGSAISTLARAGYLERFDISGERTRGTRLLRPEIEAHQLEVDRVALAEKERRDRAKLEAMIRFAYSEDCRQRWILEYFGEKNAGDCGSCDVCQASGAADRREPTDEEFLIVQKALSGIARASRRLPDGRWEGRFGKGKIVQMLVGSRSQEVTSARLHELSTHGLLKPEGTNYVYALLKELEGEGLAATMRKENFALFTLTARGAAAMRGDRSFRLRWPDRGGMTTPPTARSKSGGAIEEFALEELAFDEKLFEKLRQKRAELAEAAGGVPAYVIFGNQTLEFLTRLRPKTMEAGLRIRGIGKVKAERYLEDFIGVIREHDAPGATGSE